jgi:hypothetical protein
MFHVKRNAGRPNLPTKSSAHIRQKIKMPEGELGNLRKQGQTGYVRINVILRRVRVTTAAVEEKQLLHILGVMSVVLGPARSAHASCCHAWPARLYSISPHYGFREVTEHKMCDFLCISIKI